MSAEDVWKAELPEFDESTKHDTRRAATLLAQTHNRAGDARTLAREAVDAAERVERAVSALAAAMGPEAASAVREALRRNKK